jgi:hypothetical protein
LSNHPLENGPHWTKTSFTWKHRRARRSDLIATFERIKAGAGTPAASSSCRPASAPTAAGPASAGGLEGCLAGLFALQLSRSAVGFTPCDSRMRRNSLAQAGQYQPVFGGPGSNSIHSQPAAFGSALRRLDTVRAHLVVFRGISNARFGGGAVFGYLAQGYLGADPGYYAVNRVISIG